MTIILLVLLGVLIAVMAGVYNRLVAAKNEVDNAFGAIDAELKKRYDLIPNLVAVVKNYAAHEYGIMTKVSEMRAKAISGNISADEKVDLDNSILHSLRGVMVSMENYPMLQADENFLQLQASWNEIEEQISAARRAYNAAVTDYNNRFEMFPGSMFSNMLAFKEKPVLSISANERQNVNAEELFSK